MGFRFSKRINLGKGLGFNISKSGVSPSVRTKFGSLSTKGYSLKTGIPGVTYRKASNSRGCLLTLFVYVALGISIYEVFK